MGDPQAIHQVGVPAQVGSTRKKGPGLMTDPPRLAAALLIASMVVACDPITPTETEFDPVQGAAEKEALIAFFISTGGENWTNSGGWLVRASPCNWFGVVCTGGKVFQILMESNNLTGSIPAEFANLPTLTDLRLNSNSLTGSIPAELGNLSALSILNLLDNNLTGEIPPELGRLAGLRILWLNQNDLTGAIPAELGDLAQLADLRLHENDLTGPIPTEIGGLAALATVQLDSNSLSGPVPLPVAVLGGKLQQLSPGRCGFESNPGLSMPGSQGYVDADLDHDGFICGIALSPPSP